MATLRKTKKIPADREKHLKQAEKGVAMKHAPKPPPVEGEEARYAMVTCPAGDTNFVEYDPNRYQWYECTTCHCKFEM